MFSFPDQSGMTTLFGLDIRFYFALPMSTALSDPVVLNLAEPMLRKSLSRKGNPVL